MHGCICLGKRLMLLPITSITKLTGTKMNTRPLYVITEDIRKHWPKVNYGAKPYLDAMASLTNINDNYYADTARSVVLYFLSNSATWRGPDAKRIKAELKEMLK